jgi:hypothetical protein
MTMNQYESMDSQNKSTGTRIPETIPASLVFKPYPNPSCSANEILRQ